MLAGCSWRSLVDGRAHAEAGARAAAEDAGSAKGDATQDPSNHCRDKDARRSWTARRITQQTSTTLPLRGELTHDAPAPKALRRRHLPRPAAVGARGPRLGRAAPGGRLRAAVRGRRCSRSAASTATLHVPARARAAAGAAAAGDAAVLPARPLPHAPARARARRHRARRQRRVGRARWRWRCSACSLNGQVPSQGDWLRAWLFALLGVGLGRVALSLRPALGARAAARGQAGADHGRRRGRRAGGAAAGDPSRVRARAGRLPRRGPALGGRGRRTRRAGAGHDRGPRRDRRAHRRQAPDRRVLLGRRRARQPPDPALPGARRRGVGRAADVRHDQQPRRLRHRRRAAAAVLHDRRPQGRCSSRSSTPSTASLALAAAGRALAR